MQKEIVIQLPEKVEYIIETIEQAGYEAYAVGGCIRDLILGRTPDDWDITTSASPYQVKELFAHTIDTGIQHGTVTVMLGKEGFEVTTYRVDGKYQDGRHPEKVTFTASLAEDLKRRDFTINAMAYNRRTGLADEFGGMEDIKRKVIRCVGNPRERFLEDALRMMRAVRFSAQLGYEIEKSTSEAIRDMVERLRLISAERIQTELVKLAVSPHPEQLRAAWETGITGIILPEFDICMATEQKNLHHCYSVGEHILKSMQEIKPDKILRLAMLFHDIGKPETLTVSPEGICHFHGHPSVSAQIAHQVLRRLKFDNYTIDMVTRLVRFHDCDILPEPKHVRRAVRKIGEDVFPLLYDVKLADMKAQSTYLLAEKEERLQSVYEIYKQVLEKQECLSLKDLAVTGKDLIEEAGMSPGRELGEILKQLLDIVIEVPHLNRKEVLLSIVREKRTDAGSSMKDFQ